MAARALRRADHFARLPMARTNAKGAWSSCISTKSSSDIVNVRPKLVRFRANSGHTDFMSMRHGPLAVAIGKRLLQGQKIPPGKPLLQGAAQQERGMERGERADFAAAGLIGKPASP